MTLKLQCKMLCRRTNDNELLESIKVLEEEHARRLKNETGQEVVNE